MPDVPNPYTHRNRWHLRHMPDVTDKPVVDPTSLRLWQKDEVVIDGRTMSSLKKERQKMHHKLLSGLQGRLVNEATDKTIALNEWPVMFTDASGSPTNLIPRFTVHLWTFYCSKMKGYPGPTSKAAQKILLYLSVNPVLVSKTWRNRLYYYSSGSILGSLNVDFRSWFVLEGSQDKAFHDIRKVR